MFGVQFGVQFERNSKQLRRTRPNETGREPLSATRTLGLGAGRSQVQILSPPLRNTCKIALFLGDAVRRCVAGWSQVCSVRRRSALGLQIGAFPERLDRVGVQVGAQSVLNMQNLRLSTVGRLTLIRTPVRIVCQLSRRATSASRGGHKRERRLGIVELPLRRRDAWRATGILARVARALGGPAHTVGRC